MKKYLLLTCLLYLGFQTNLQAQDSLNIKPGDPVKMVSFDFGYKGFLPWGDWKGRFGFSSTIGAQLTYKTRSQWYFGAGVSYLFGGQVKEDSILQHITNPSGFLIADDGTLVEPRLNQSGFLVPFTVGKIFSVFPVANRNTGLYIEAGPQFMQHKIQISSSGAQVGALADENKKGYDRLTSGIGLHESIGIRFYGRNPAVNFALGLNFGQMFTQSRRSINIDNFTQETDTRMDLYGGFNFTWIILFYQEAGKRYYVY